VKTATPREGRAVFRGRLRESGPEVVTLALDEGPAVDIPFPHDSEGPRDLRVRRQRRAPVSREIIEALRQIEKEKGISAETLLSALEDALHSAYRKTPEAVETAKVEIIRDR